MKRFLFYLLMLPLVFGCGKLPTTNKGGVYVNNSIDIELRSAFVGGGIADPSVGSSHRFHMYEGNYQEGPLWDEVKEVVYIGGFRHSGKDYSNLADCIDEIAINGLPSIGSLSVTMNQGRYEGGNEFVSAVRINEYSFGEYDKEGNQIKNSQIDIDIILKDGRTISVRYSGKTPYDGYY